MTKDEWLQVQDKLSRPWGTVKLTVDGYALNLQVMQIKPLKYAIVVLVNGVCKVEWASGEAEEAKRFCHPVKKSVFSPARKKAVLKGLSKANAKWATKELELDKTWTRWDMWWPSFGPLKRHLIANNKSIELAAPTPEKLELDTQEKEVIGPFEFPG